jgi:hypothetical protein
MAFVLSYFIRNFSVFGYARLSVLFFWSFKLYPAQLLGNFISVTCSSRLSVVLISSFHNFTLNLNNHCIVIVQLCCFRALDLPVLPILLRVLRNLLSLWFVDLLHNSLLGTGLGKTNAPSIINLCSDLMGLTQETHLKPSYKQLEL